ncbi:MAG: type II/IV secretion system ATPase subunit [Sulfolobales archaeon]
MSRWKKMNLFNKINFFSRFFSSPRLKELQDNSIYRESDSSKQYILPGGDIPEENYEELLEYDLGIYRISLAKINDEYMYLVRIQDRYRDLESRFRHRIRSLKEEFILRLSDTHVMKERELREIIEKYNGFNDESEFIFYILKEELGYKKLQVFLEDPYVEDISISGVGPIWVRHSFITSIDPRVDLVRSNVRIENISELIEIQQLIASKVGKAISHVNPILDIQLPTEDGGHRVHLVGPSVAGERIEVTIRKNILRKITIDDLIRREMINEAVAEYFRELILRRGSLVIAGAPGSGKTTLLRAILNSYVPRNWKVIIIEDTPEIEIPQDSSWVKYTTYETGIARVDQYILTKAALRSSVNKIIVIGETRGAEAKILAQALNMGLGALTTFHGGSSREVITRLMSPPISLKPYQVSSIRSIAVLGIENNKRILKFIDEIIPGINSIRIRRIYNYLEDLNKRSIIYRSYHLGEALKKSAESY